MQSYLDGRSRMPRNGGRVTRRGGKLYRISRSGAGQYGSSSFSFHEILALTRSDYKEALVETIRRGLPISACILTIVAATLR